MTSRFDIPMVFFLVVPESLNEATWDGTIHLAITNWMKKKVLKDTRSFVRRYSQKLDLYPKDVRVKEQKHLWGSMGKDDILNINWTLVYAPKQILEYVVIHELCHLRTVPQSLSRILEPGRFSIS